MTTYILAYQVTVWGDTQPPVTTSADNRDQIHNLVEDAVCAGYSVLVTQQSKDSGGSK